MNTRTYSPSGRRTKGWLKAALFGASFALLGAAHAQTVTIPAANTNTASNRQPLGNFWGYERTHFLIRAAEIGVTGNITSIGFYVNSLSSPAATTPVVIKMKTSTNTTVTSSAYATASTGATTVYTGNITSGMLSANSWVTITLSTPFAYAGNSLEVFVEANGGGSGIEGGSAKLFRWAAPSPAATCCQYWNADNSPPTSNGTTNAYRPNVQLAISAAAPCSGTPNAGSVTSPVSICGGSAATLSATGVSTGGTITYQWQESPDGASGWANVVGGSGATTTTYTTTAVNATRYFRMVTTCGNSGQSNNTNTVTVNALTATYATYTPAGLSEGFEAWGNQCSTNDVPGGNWKNTPSTGNNSWRRNDQPNDGGWQYPTGGTYTPASSQGTYSARFHSYGSTSGLQGSLDYYVNMGAGTGADQISFDFINPTGGDVLAVLVSTDGGATFTQIGSNLATSSAWTNKTLSLSSTSATTVIRLRATSDYGDDDIGVDNFKITSPCSGTPLAGTVTSPVGICSGFAAVLTATGTSSGPGISYQWQESPDGTSGWANVSGGSGATTTTYTTTAVNATRYFRMVTTCSGSGQSNNTNVVTVNVLAPVYATYTVAGVSEGFENWINLCSSKDVPGTNWKSTPATGNNSWRRDDQGMSDGGWTSNGGAYSPLFSQGAHSARFHSYNATSGLQGALDYYVNMSGGTGADQISFDFINPTGTDVLAVLVSTDGGTTFTQIGSNLTTSSAWTNKTFSLSSTSATTVIRLRATSDYGDNDIGVDNFKIQSPCMGTPTAGTISGNTPAICVGNGNTLTLSGASAGIGISYQWKSSTTAGGPYTNMGTALTQATGNLTQTTYYVVTVTCSGSGQTSTTPEVAVVVNPLPTPSITPGPTANFCVSGTLTSSAATGNVWSPGGATTPSITASASGNYTVTVTDGNGCTGTSAATAVTISTQPAALSVTPASPAAFCAGGNVNLTASGGSYSATQTMNFGTQAAQNTAGATSSTDYPAPFTAYWGGQRMQMLIRASELTAAGFTAGAVFNGINFPVVSFGTDWPSIISSCQSFMVKFGYTTATTITAFQTLATTVRPAANFTPTVGYNNLLSFSTTPAAWNGTDNVIIETTFSNNITGTSAKSVIQYNSPTTYSSCIQYRADGVTAATAAAGTVVSYTYNARPDFKLMGTQAGQAPFTWSPATGLNTVNGPTVTASPATTQAYTVTATNGACTSTANVTVTVNPLPVINCPGNSSVCINTPAYALNGASPAGGTYSGTGVSGGSFDPAAAGLGAHTITYSYTDGNGCTNTPCTFTITVNPLPVVSCPGNMTGITTTDAAFALAGHGESPAGGTFSGTGVSGGNFDPAVAGAGMHTITYTYTDGNSCGGSCTFTIAVALPPCNGNQVVMKIITDNNAAQLGWEFFDSGNATLASGTLTAADNNTTVTQTVCMSYNPGAGCYTFKLMDSFGDGITGGGWELRTTGGALILRDEFGNGSVSPANPPASASYGSGHSFCLPLGPANIAATECGIFDNLQGNKVYCNKVTGATQYQFEFSNPDAGFIRRIVRTTNYVQFWDMVANPLVLGVHYFARVRTNVAGPVASAHWGSGCEMGLAATVPCSGLIPAPNYGHSCNETRSFNTNNSFIYATPVVGASQYQFRIFNASEGYDETFIRSTYILQLKWNTSVAPPLANGSTYNVEVNVRVGDTYSGFCASSCAITIDNTGTLLGGELEQTGIGEASMWPNPVRDGQVNLSIGDLKDAEQHITVDMQDIYGKQVFAREFGNSGERFSTILQLPNDIASGVYMVNITVNGQRTVQRLSIVK